MPNRTGTRSLLFSLLYLWGLVSGVAFAQNSQFYDPGFCAVSPDPSAFTVSQPDGTTFSAVQRGSGAAVYLETADGYTVLPDPADDTYKLAVEGADGELLLTDILAADPADRPEADARRAASLKPHARLSGESLNTVVEAYAERGFDEGDHEHFDDRHGVVARRRGGFPALGTHRALMLLIDFPDMRATYAVADIERMCNEEGYARNGQMGSFRDYYRDVSYGQLTVDTEVQPWATAAHPRGYYGIKSFQDRDYSKAPALVREAVDAAEARGLDFSEFDGDGDGDVDMVLVIHAGRGAEESRDTADIWSHRWGLGQHHVSYDGVRIRDYIIQPELYRGNGQLANIGVLVHEFGHAIGLPDLYDTDGSSEGLSTWCVMAGGTWANGGRTPTQPSAWCKAALGWTIPAEVEESASGYAMGLLPTGRAASAYQFFTGQDREYFLVESRERTGWDRYLPAAGVLVYHVDETRANNRDEDHRLVDIEQADGLARLNAKGGRADATDVFGSHDARRSLACTPQANAKANTVLYDGTASGVRLSDIAYAAAGTNFRYGGCTTCVVAEIAVRDTVLDCASGTYVQNFAVRHNRQTAGDTLVLEISTGTQVFRDTGLVVAGADSVLFSVTDLPMGAGATDALAYFADEALCHLDVSGVTGGIVGCGRNDDICDAADITAALRAGRAIPGTTRGYTAQVGEPTPAQTAWDSQEGWGETSLTRTAWYKFTAPPSGHVDIDFDNVAVQAAIWEASTCTDILDEGLRLGVAASDDVSARDYGPHLAEVRCLLPGHTYYLQVDSEFDAEHDFTFVARVGTGGCHAISSTTSCHPAQAAASTGTGTWRQAVTGRDKQVAAAYNDRQRSAGEVTIRRSSAASTEGLAYGADGRSVSQVSWHVSLGAEAPLTARFYLSDADWSGLREQLEVGQLSELQLQRYRGEDCGSFTEASTVHPSTVAIAGYNGEDHILQFDLPGGGNYALLRSAPMPVSYVGVTAFAKTHHNVVKWRTTEERELERFILEARTQGTTEAAWREVATQAPVGGGDYTLVDEAPSVSTYYRIRNEDTDGGWAYSDVVFVSRPPTAEAHPTMTIAPNPASDWVEVHIASAEQITVRDLSGRLLLSVAVDAEIERHMLDASDLATGTYIVTAHGQVATAVTRLVVR